MDFNILNFDFYTNFALGGKRIHMSSSIQKYYY